MSSESLEHPTYRLMYRVGVITLLAVTAAPAVGGDQLSGHLATVGLLLALTGAFHPTGERLFDTIDHAFSIVRGDRS